MGTQLQFGTYFPGYCSLRGPGEEADSNWSPFYDGRTLSGHLYNGFAPRSLDVHSQYDKEMLKRTILEHEATFRRQLYDLHRLYRTQKDLMDELQYNGLHSYSIQADGNSKSNSFSSQMPSENTKRIWQMPHVPVVRTTYSTAPVSRFDDMRPPLNLFNESRVPPGQFSIENGASQKDRDLKKPSREMLDLQLPADVYIHSEDDVKLTLGTGECLSHQEHSCRLDRLGQNGLPVNYPADTNRPVGQIFHDIPAGSASTCFIGPNTQYEAQGLRLPMSSNTNVLGLHSSQFKDRHSNEGSCSNFPNASEQEITREWPLCNTEAGESRISVSFLGSGLHYANLSMPSEPIQSNPAKNHEILLYNKAPIWIGQKPELGIEISGRTPSLAMSNNSGSVAPGTPTSFPVSPLVSASAKPVNSASHIVQALPCFNGSMAGNITRKRSNTIIEDSRSACNIWQHNGDSRPPHLGLGDEGSIFRNGFHDHYQVDSYSAPFAKLNVNTRADENHGPQKRLKDLQLTNMRSETNTGANASSSGISWLTRKTASNGFMDLKTSGSKAMDQELGSCQENEKDPALVDLQEFPLTPLIESRTQKSEGPESLSCTKILGFPILEKEDSKGGEKEDLVPTGKRSSNPINLNLTCIDDREAEAPSLHTMPSVAEETRPQIDLEVPLASHSSDLVLICKRSSNPINLNSMCIDDPEAEAPLPPTMPSVSEEVPPQTDLDVLLASYSSENILPREESAPPSKMDDDSQVTESPENILPHEALLREAAKSIVQLSLDKRYGFSDVTCDSSSSAMPDTLISFAEVALFNDCSETSDSGLDDFELMTLKLEETKAEEYLPREPENHKEGGKGAASASLLLKRPQRGQARRRRQTRDFQKDILPGLASLSRREVNEDLQTIGLHCEGTGWRRRRPRSLVITVAEIQVSSTQSTVAEVELEGRTMIGWGRKTRRCQRGEVPKC